MSQKCCGSSCAPDEIVSDKETPFSSDAVTSLRVSGMDCADEVAAVQRVFKLPSVKRVDANLMHETVTVYHDRSLSLNEISHLITKAGLKVVSESPQSFYKDHSRRMFLVASSGFCLGIGLVLDWVEFPNAVLFNFLYLISILLAGSLIFPKALRSLRGLSLDMNVLMTVAVFGAVGIKEYSEAASVVFLFSLAELLEAMSVSRARKAIQEVLKISPKEATVINEEGNPVQKPVQELKLDDVVLIRPGETIPIDGLILAGITTANQASLTGESRPVEKKPGDEVFAGSINEAGAIRVKVSKLFQDTKISQIISLIEDAQKQKAPSQRFVDKFAKIYTPAILILALLVGILPPLLFGQGWESWIYKALVLLVIGCPCALVIATPVSVVSGLTFLARRGILVKGGVHLESLGKLRALALDKTGTITNGTPEVAELRLFSSLSEEQVIRLTASLESMTSHPLALAITKYAEKRRVSFQHPTEFRMITGKGAEGKVEGHWYFVGNHKLAHELGVCTEELERYLDDVESRSMSIIVLGHTPHEECKGEILAVFALGDTIRPNIRSTIQDLHQAGIKRVTMLSGDNQKTVDAVAALAGIDSAKGTLLPDEKVNEIKLLVNQFHYVGMVGDGVNDAPALANATIGIAMGVIGSDTAIETADVALMKDDLSMLPAAIRHGRRVLGVIRFNIGFAILIKAVFLGLAFFGMTNLWLAVAADMGASLLVTFNALRLLRK